MPQKTQDYAQVKEDNSKRSTHNYSSSTTRYEKQAKRETIGRERGREGASERHGDGS
jgi:hypothetical protein